MNLIDCNPAPALVSALYPELRRIQLFVALAEAGPAKEPNYQQIIFTADSQAAFRLDCTQEDCVCGGFDFAPAIATLVDSQEVMGQGVVGCSGTIQPGSTRCMLLAEYRIVIE